MMLPARDGVGEDPVVRTIARLSGDVSGGALPGDGFAILPWPARPRLLLPLGDGNAARAGLRLYNNTYEWRGRLLSWLLQLAVAMGPRLYARHQVAAAAVDSSLKRLMREALGEAQPVLAAWLGDPDRYWKLIVQVMRPSGEILGYLKVPMTPESAVRTRAEAEILRRLGEVPPLHDSVPRILYAGEWNGGFVLLESACAGRPGPTTMTQTHRAFLRLLHSVEPQQKAASTLIAEVAGRCEKAASRLNGWSSLSANALAWARQAMGDAPVDCSFSHGDFVPWNMLFDGNRISVIDWEFAGTGKPIAWDCFHFAVQVAAIRRTVVEPQCLGPVRDPAHRALYLLYLLDSTGALLLGGHDPRTPGVQMRHRLITELRLKEGRP